MGGETVPTTAFLAKTRSAFLWTQVFVVPFWSIFNILFIILYKDLHATPLQIMAVVALKPLSSLFSPYWSLFIHKRQDRLISNLVWANILKFLPFLFFPWYSNNWCFILSLGVFMAFKRGMIPAWMEIMKLNIQGNAREKVFATGSAIDYLGCAILPLFFGWILDDYQQSWRWLFFCTALIGIGSTIFFFCIPLNTQAITLSTPPPSVPALKDFFLKPWQHSWQLLYDRPDFARFQIGYLLGGSALMMIHTTLAAFYIDVLHLSYTNVMAMTACKSIGFVFASPWWVKWFEKANIYRICGWVTIFAALFPVLLILATLHISCLYIGFVLYGIMQAGSELTWHMSGPIFAKEQDSSTYSGTNVLLVGMRGCVAPLLGTSLYMATNSWTVMLVSCLMCLLATERMWHFSKRIGAEVRIPT